MARNIQSLERAAAMLRLLAGGERRLGLSDIASSLGLAKGTAHGILRTLQQEGFVEQDEASGRYQLGAELPLSTLSYSTLIYDRALGANTAYQYGTLNINIINQNEDFALRDASGSRAEGSYSPYPSPLEDPNWEPEEDLFLLTRAPWDAPARPEYVTLTFESGTPVAVDRAPGGMRILRRLMQTMWRTIGCGVLADPESLADAGFRQNRS